MTDEFDSSVPDSSSESFDSAPEVMPEIPSDSEPELESAPEFVDEPEIESVAEIQSEPELIDEPESTPELTPELINEPEIEPAAEIQIEPESVPELTPEFMDEPEIEPAAEIQIEPESAPELTPEFMDEPEIEPAAEIQTEPESAPELAPELMDEPEIEPLAEIQPEPDSLTDHMDESEIEPVTEIQPDLVDDYIGDENSIDETPVDNPIAIGNENPLVDEIPIGDEISVDENPVDVEPSAGGEVPVGNEIVPEIQSESQPVTEGTLEGEVDESAEYLIVPDAISEDDDILQQVDSSAVNPEMISEQDGLVEEGSPEKQMTAGTEPEANVSSIANATGSYSQIGVQGSLVDSEDDAITLQSQIDEPSQRQPFKTDYSENDLGKAATEINNENMDINHTDAVLQKQIEQTGVNRAEFRDTAAQYGMTPEVYLDYLGQRLNDPENTPELQPIQPADSGAQVDDVISAQGGSSGEIPPMPTDTNVIKDAQERDITIRRWGDDELIQLRAYDSAAGNVPETPNLGTAGMTNLKIEAEPDGQTKVRLQDIVIPPDYRNSGIASNMLDETVNIAQSKGASEIYGVIENEEALNYWKHMEEKGTGWKVDSSQGAHGYVRYDLSDASKKKALN